MGVELKAFRVRIGSSVIAGLQCVMKKIKRDSDMCIRAMAGNTSGYTTKYATLDFWVRFEFLIETKLTFKGSTQMRV